MKTRTLNAYPVLGIRASIAVRAGLALCLGGLACAEESAQIEAKPVAPSVFAKDETTVSIFGIFRDGRLSQEAWQKYGSALSAPFGKGQCVSAYTANLAAVNPILSSAADDYAKENGITDQLLDQFSPAAEGKVIVALSVVGPLSPKAHSERAEFAGVQQQGRGGAGQGMGGGGRGMGGGRHQQGASAPPSADHSPDRAEFQFSASFFSVRLHRSVATETFRYSGANLDEALQKFAARIAVVLPGAACSGWNWQVPVDAARIRQMLDQ